MFGLIFSFFLFGCKVGIILLVLFLTLDVGIWVRFDNMVDLLLFVLWTECKIEWCIVVVGVGVFGYTPLQSFSWKLGILGFSFLLGAWG